MRKNAYLLMLLLIAAANSATADYDAGLNAYRAGHYDVALAEFRGLAEAGDPKAQYALGLMYAKGQGVSQDYGETLSWYLKSARQGYSAAQNNLGLMHAKGHGVPKDYQEAIRWYLRAARQGYSKAQNSLALLYVNGQGVDQDYIQAYAWFNVAAKHGHALAKRNRDALGKKMTASQRREARKLSKGILAKYENNSD